MRQVAGTMIFSSHMRCSVTNMESMKKENSIYGCKNPSENLRHRRAAAVLIHSSVAQGTGYDFLVTYALQCDEYGEYEKGKQVLLEIVEKDKRWSREDIPELLEAYTGLLKFSCALQDFDMSEFLEGMCRKLGQYKGIFRSAPAFFPPTDR